MERWRSQILERVASPTTLDLAQRTMAGIPQMAGAVSEDELRQLLHGFCQMLEESMAQGGGPTRRLFLETAVPALVAAGQEPGTLIRSTGTFAVLVTAAALEDLDPADREPAAEWLATFFGEYLQDVAAAAAEAKAEAGG